MLPSTEWTGEFRGAGGARLFRRRWRPAEPARAVVACIHGLGDHSGLYQALVEFLVARGIAVHAPDLRGNGRSPGRRAYVDSWDEFREDLRRFLEVVQAEEPGRPVFLLGNSLGGLIVLEYALHHPEGLRGVVAASPPLGRLGVPAPLMLLGRVLSTLWPTFSMRTGMDLSGLARDPTVASTVLADPLFHRVGTARLSTEVVAAIARVQSGAPRFPLPLLLLHGGSDRMVPPEGTRRLAAATRHPDVRLVEYAEGYHALLADIGRERVLADLEQWVSARL
ncbi:MAG TPA: alpha/beta hydrolase [Gemmatimonadales bacterium]|nr:alpha/beta hydrolase [Gemmatimonadales bacterium]